MNNTNDALANRIRAAMADVRRKNYPLADLIPMMQEAAEALSRQPADAAQGWIELVQELCPDGIEQACDECGGDDSECSSNCVYRRARAMLAASQPAADNEESILQERDDAEDFIDVLLDEVLGADRAEWSSAYGRADALADVRERMNALLAPMVDKAWNRFEKAAQPEPPETMSTKELAKRVAAGERWSVAEPQGERALLAKRLLEHADAIEGHLAVGAKYQVGDPADCAAPIMRQAAALLAADSRADGEVVKRGFVQVPFRMNQAMRDVTDSEGWTWEDLLGAAEAITEEQYDELAADPAPAEPEPLTEFDVRGMLASRLSCWHRLSLQEAYKLVEIFSAHHIGKPEDKK